ncbi:hypothetical protein ACO3VM_05620 [Methanocaldococcus sp. 10A]
MDIELILFIAILFLFPYLIILIIVFDPHSILGYLLYKRYKKAKKEWHYITSTKIGMNRNRWSFTLMTAIIALFFVFYLLININHPDNKIIAFSIIFLSIAVIYDELNPTSGNVEIYKEGVIVYYELFDFLKPFLNYYLVLPWKFFKGYKVKSKNKRKYIILIPKSKLFFNIHIIDNDNIEEIIKNYLNPIQ